MSELSLIILCMVLMFITGSCVQFWLWFIDLEKTKQIILKDFIFKEKKNK